MGGRGATGWRAIRARVVAYWPLLLVFVVVAWAMQRVLTEHWRQGSAWLGVAALVAAGLRFALPSDRVGLLAIRGRMADALCYGGFGFAVLSLALTIEQGSLTLS